MRVAIRQGWAGSGGGSGRPRFIRTERRKDETEGHFGKWRREHTYMINADYIYILYFPYCSLLFSC